MKNRYDVAKLNGRKNQYVRGLIEALKNGDIGIMDDPNEEEEIINAYLERKLEPVKDAEIKRQELIDASLENNFDKQKRKLTCLQN